MAEQVEPILAYVRDAVAWCDRTNERRDAKIAELEAQGFRIVKGGDYERPVRDWRTDQMLAAGSDEDPEAESFDENRWYHIDPIEQEAHEAEPTPTTDDLPEGLADVLLEWVFENEEAARQWVQG